MRSDMPRCGLVGLMGGELGGEAGAGLGHHTLGGDETVAASGSTGARGSTGVVREAACWPISSPTDSRLPASWRTGWGDAESGVLSDGCKTFEIWSSLLSTGDGTCVRLIRCGFSAVGHGALHGLARGWTGCAGRNGCDSAESALELLG